MTQPWSNWAIPIGAIDPEGEGQNRRINTYYCVMKCLLLSSFFSDEIADAEEVVLHPFSKLSASTCCFSSLTISDTYMDWSLNSEVRYQNCTLEILEEQASWGKREIKPMTWFSSQKQASFLYVSASAAPSSSTWRSNLGWAELIAPDDPWLRARMKNNKYYISNE